MIKALIAVRSISTKIVNKISIRLRAAAYWKSKSAS